MTASEAGSFEPGAIFARRYRLVHRLRSSAMTDVWRADDLILQSQVAVEVVTSTNDANREEILQKILLVRRLKHPAICRVFDAGESDGRMYCSLELVDGESLRTVVRRAGRLPSEKVASIGRQLCGGLAALHAAGLAATIDPWTVLLDSRGSVRIVDLGLGSPAIRPGPGAPAMAEDVPASVRGELSPGTPQSREFSPGTPRSREFSPGTPRSREFSPGTPRSREDSFWPRPWPASDAYAMGALLYELLVGASPERGHRLSRAPLKPSMFLANVDSRLEQVIMDALADDPGRRPASAAAMAVALTRLPGSARPGWTGWVVAAAAIAAVIATLGLLGAWLDPSPPPPLTEHDTIVLADITNTTSNPVFDGTLKVALAVALEQSPFLRIYPDERARETLRLMQRAPDEGITAAVARDIARREQLKALVSGSIGPAGEGYAVTLEAIEASTGQVMAREFIEAASADQVLGALGTAASRLRSQLGESLSSIERFDAPLPQATTASLDALHAYSLALDRGRMVPRAESIPYLERAIALDPGFAMAHAALSGVYRNIDRSAEAPQFSRRAFELRDRVSERERFVISWRYYVDAAQAWDKALELSASWTRTYPREAFAFNSLGMAAAAFGDHDQAVRAFREAIRLDPGFVPSYGNLAGSLIASNRFAEAKAQLTDAGHRGIAFITVRRMAYTLALIENDPSAMTRELDLVRQSSDAVWAGVWEAKRSAFAGEPTAAHDLFQRGAQSAVDAGARELAAQWTMEDAEVHAIAGDCDPARREVAAGLALSRDNFTLERAARALALCDDRDRVKPLTDELRMRFPEATLLARIQLPVISAIDAIRQRQPARAIAALEPVIPYDYAPAAELWPLYLRGEAYLQLKDGRSAATQFRAILDHRGAAPASPLYPLAQRRLAAIENPRAHAN